MSEKATEPTRIVSPPEGWMPEGVEFEDEPTVFSAKSKGGPVVLISATLTDHSNLVMLSYPEGQGSLRRRPDSEKIEHHFQGRKPSYDPTVQRLWKAAVDLFGEALDRTREQLGPIRPSA